MKRLMIVLFLMIIVGFYVLFFVKNTQKVTVDNTIQKVEALPIEKKMRIITVQTVGLAHAYDSVIISSKRKGYINGLFFKDGDLVSKDQKLISLVSEVLEARLLEAIAREEEAQQQYNRLKKLIKTQYTAQSELDAQEATLLSAKAQVLRIKALINEYTIRAPFAGVIGFKRISVGAMVEAGDPIVALDVVSPIYIDFYLSEKYLYQLEIGQAFEARSIALPKRVLKAKIKLIENRVNERIGSILVRGEYENKKGLVKPGMSLTVTVPVSKSMVVTIPEEALLIDGAKRYIFVVYPKTDIAKQVYVHIIRRVDNEIDINNSFPPDTLVITSGGHKINDGQKVEVSHVAK